MEDERRTVCERSMLRFLLMPVEVVFAFVWPIAGYADVRHEPWVVYLLLVDLQVIHPRENYAQRTLGTEPMHCACDIPLSHVGQEYDCASPDTLVGQPRVSPPSSPVLCVT